ncbi:type I-E CRISPR-associated protein Cse2/CasB [Methylomicrobium lacus]|uniref:type I-E CRISPR-associated protein Cse2/CasB n=1 Tax=Methylomicrobium lacus TaxID=136992 RepID=UPI00045E841F|nr:type I-E CRISPR-associated protein Cse2/CasB [Methylomicrobium lacus]
MSHAQTKEATQRFLDTLHAEFDGLSNGDKAAIRRTVEPDDLLLNPAFYRLVQETLNQFQETELSKARDFFKNLSQVARLVYLLPFIKHQPLGKSLGTVLRENEISERRLFLVTRSEYPQDLIQLRRLCQQFKDETVDAIKLGKLLLYWGKHKTTSEGSKRQLMKDFYLSFASEKMEPVDADY